MSGRRVDARITIKALVSATKYLRVCPIVSEVYHAKEVQQGDK